ncbi:hypothetical protein PMKS-001182 [Pichia membranifaciens]|uniref:Uncharacterized protein n=1 Tax=Pichia membranifaciens TaxID=4926 RepID=A0A1Q2YDW4_9ASCO|nr:hypothetical protein PMKS-001182 [Pichia membranifaciens]
MSGRHARYAVPQPIENCPHDPVPDPADVVLYALPHPAVHQRLNVAPGPDPCQLGAFLQRLEQLLLQLPHLLPAETASEYLVGKLQDPENRLGLHPVQVQEGDSPAGHFLMIWKWANNTGLGQVQLKCYLANSKNVKKVIEKNLRLLKRNPNLPNTNTDNSLTLPQDMLYRLADEVGICNVTTANYLEPAPFGELTSRSASTPSALSSTQSSSSSTSSTDSVNTLEPAQRTVLAERLGESVTLLTDDNEYQYSLPDYETAMLQKVQEHERMMNSLVKLPSYATGTYSG